jgi:hypothetical protein
MPFRPWDFIASRNTLRKAEVENLGVPPFGDKNVGRLDVAMDDAFGMGSIERVGDFNCEAEQHFGLDGFAGNSMLEGRTGEGEFRN